jgi:hypothetical protein
MENKARETAVTKINDRLDENVLLFRRSIGADHEWMLGANAGSEGVPMNRSRLMWEIDNWAVPIPIEGKAQKQNPDDDTADGADAIASMRYALLSAWRPGALAHDFGREEIEDRAKKFDHRRRKSIEPKHAKDVLFPTTGGRRAPRVQGVRPRLFRNN